MKELGDSINVTLSESEHIAQVIEKIKTEEYDVFLVLEATIGFNRREESSRKSSPLDPEPRTTPEFKPNLQDLKFLKSLRISIDDTNADKDPRAA